MFFLSEIIPYGWLTSKYSPSFLLFFFCKKILNELYYDYTAANHCYLARKRACIKESRSLMDNVAIFGAKILYF